MRNEQKELSKATQDKLRELIEINVDSVKGFQHAEKAVDDDQLKLEFKECARERNAFANELSTFTPPSTRTVKGTMKGRVHRWWLDLRASIAEDERPQVLKEVVRGENAILDLYKEVLTDIAGSQATDVLNRQVARIKRARDEFARRAETA